MNTPSANPAWLDPVTGKAYKLRTLPDGSYHPEDVRRLQDAVCDFFDDTA